MRKIALLLLFLPLPAIARVDGPDDNQTAQVRRIPKEGIDVPDEIRRELEQGLKQLETTLATITPRADLPVLDLRPDAAIFHKAVADALNHNEFFDPAEFDKARVLLREGQRRAEILALGRDPDWTRATGRVVRAYVSKIDGSIQPYGLVIPESYEFRGKDRYRLDIWFHGRGETLSELNFIHERMTRDGEFTPRDTIVLHPYGRYCNAFKFAGEVDVYEALDSTRTRYKIDDDRISERGFSMGGAAAWQFAVHDPTRWFAANPGAGFSETPRFLNVFQSETLDPPWYERTLWSLYDCDKWAGNLRMVPTVAYSGEIDKQKQAADIMAEALKPYGVELAHIIGPNTAHKYEPGAKQEVERRLDDLARLGRQPAPGQQGFRTFTLRYNQSANLTIDALEEHWKPAEIRLGVFDTSFLVEIDNVTAFTIDYPAGSSPLSEEFLKESAVSPGPDREFLLSINHLQWVDIPLNGSDRSWRASFHKAGDTWKLGPLPDDGGLRKKHGLQGPIDDAFMDSFMFVRPTGESSHPKLAAWSNSELDRAIEHWRRHFRGVARVKDDTEITDTDIAAHNLVLWGDPSSNAILRRIADKLPIVWTDQAIQVGDTTHDAAHHALIAIYPNPLNPERYVVLNSSFTFREYDYLNNARQTPKLPDWAVIDLDTPPDSRHPGKVVAADFFDERWQLKPPRNQNEPAVVPEPAQNR